MSENSPKFDERKLFEPLDRSLVGNDGRGNDIIAWYLVADRLNRWFGPTGWDLRTTRPRLLQASALGDLLDSRHLDRTDQRAHHE